MGAVLEAMSDNGDHKDDDAAKAELRRKRYKNLSVALLVAQARVHRIGLSDVMAYLIPCHSIAPPPYMCSPLGLG